MQKAESSRQMVTLDRRNTFTPPLVIRIAWRNHLWAAGVLVCLLSVPVFAQQTNPTTRTRDDKDAPVVVQPGAPGQPTRTLPSSTRATLPAPRPADVQFMRHMIVHHAQAVEMTALIESHTDNKELRTLGDRISRSQSDEMRFMKRWLAARRQEQQAGGSKEEAAAGGTGQQQAAGGGHAGHQPAMHSSDDHHMLMPGMLTATQMEALREAKGEEFDRLFLSGMIQHHNGALEMVKDLFDTPGAGEDAELFNFATDVDSGQRAEIRVMQKMLLQKP